MALNAEIFFERDSWSKPLALSLAFHALLFGGIIVYGVVMGLRRGEDWGGTGGGGGAMSATLVNSIPLPANPEGRNLVATENKGLSQSLPKELEKTPKAIPIPERDARTRPERVPRSTTQQKPRPVVEATNV